MLHLENSECVVGEARKERRFGQLFFESNQRLMIPLKEAAQSMSHLSV